MQLTSLILFFLLAFSSIRANASCAYYHDCKCHDSTTGLQNDAVTKKACEAYGSDTDAKYADAPHHQVRGFFLKCFEAGPAC
jgi:hypothetical protein